MSQQSIRLFAFGLWTVLSLVVSVPSSASAQIPVVGILDFEPPPPGASAAPPQLKELGQYEGRTFVIEARYVRGDIARFPALARELLDHKPAVIVTTCGPALRAIRKLDTAVPVIAGCADPRNFFDEIASLSHPGGRTTGYTFLAPDSAAKRLQLLKELVPSLSRVGVLYIRTDDWHTYFDEMERAAQQLGLTLARLPIARADDLDGVFATAARQRIEAIVVLPDATIVGAADRIGALAIKYKLPSVFDIFEFGPYGLLAYGPEWAEFALPVIASYVDKILRGASPGDLPVQQPTRLKLAVNLRTANALGLIVPEFLLVRADAVLK